MVVGEDYKAATSSMNHVGAVQMPVCNAGDTMKQMVGPSNMVIRRNGWIYIYLSNESAQDVYFDNLVVNLKHGPLVEQKDYYAFGMENPTLSTQALKPSYNPNRNRYNGKELQAQEFKDGSGLTWDDYGARMYDPQIGRWMVNDPLSEKNRRWSGYNYAVDNPVRFIDPDGMESVETYGQKTEDYSGNSHTYKIDGKNVSEKDAMAYANAKLSTEATTSSSTQSADNTSISTGPGPKTPPAAKPGTPTPHDIELAKYGKVIFGVSAIGSIGTANKGFAVEYGTVTTDKDWHQEFKTIYRMTTIVNASLSAGGFVVDSRPGMQTTFSDWAGPVKEGSGSIGIFSLSHTWSTTYQTNGLGIGPSASLPAGVSGSYLNGVTYLIGQPYQIDESKEDFVPGAHIGD